LWRTRVRKANRDLTRLQTTRDNLKEELSDKKGEVDQLGDQIVRLTKVGELFRTLMDKLVLDQVRSIEAVVSEGLRTIFHDQVLSFEADVGVKYNKVSIDFLICQGKDESVIKGSPLDSFGGGPTSVASLILRLLTLIRLKRQPILLLDETLGCVSDDYLDASGRFLQKLADTTGIDILLITHKQALLEHAKLAYQGVENTEDDGSWSLGLRKLRAR